MMHGQKNIKLYPDGNVSYKEHVWPKC